MKQRLKRFLFWLLRKDADAIVVAFASSDAETAARMFAEICELTPGRRHVLITPAEFTGFGALWKRLRPYRIGLAPVLFTGEPEFRAMRRAAAWLAPTKILAYNRRLERHHLRLSTIISSWLFLRGVPLDRIHLRPRWLYPWKKGRSWYPDRFQEHEGRAFANRPRVGIVTPYFPYPLAHGGAVRIYNLIREMAAQFDIVLLSFHDEEQAEVTPLLQFCSRVYVMKKPRYREPRWSSLVPPEVAEFRAALMRDLVRMVRQELRIDVLQVEYTALAELPGDVLVEHDVTFALFRQIRQRERTLAAWWNYWRWLRFEKRQVKRYRRVVVMSDQDRRLLNAANVVAVPNGVDLERFYPEHERPGERLLFIGSFRHFPNIVAFRFFVDEVWPKLRDRQALRLLVVAGPEPLLYWREHTGLAELPVLDGVELLAFVSDVRPLYIEANLVLAPTLVSAGTNLKVLEALAMERAVVSTSSGCAGLDLEHGTNVWIADGAEAFAKGVRTLLEDHPLRQRIAAGGRRHAELRFSWKQLGAQQRTMLRQLIHPERSVRAATQADLQQIWQIQSTAPEASQWHREDYLAFDCSVMEVDGKVAGFLVSRETVPGEHEILNIAVHPEYRRLGIASGLIRNEIEKHSGDHFLEVRQSNIPARAAYQKLGFREVGVRPGYYDDPPESGIVMRFFS